MMLAAGEMRVRLGTRRADTRVPSWLPGAEVVRIDLADPATLNAALKDAGAVVHLAAVNEVESAKDPEKALQVNGFGALRLLRASVQAGVPRFVYLSTAHVYGAPLAGHITERVLPRPAHPYAITHHVAEDFVLAAHDKKDITGIVLRLSNGFGVPAHKEVDRWMLLVNDLCAQAVRERRLVLHSSGLQPRDFITLHDTARAVQHVLRMPRGVCGDGLFNAGGDCSLRVVDMALKIVACCQKELGYVPELVRPEPLPGETGLSLDYDISKLKSTGFALEGDMDGEICRTLRMCAASRREDK